MKKYSLAVIIFIALSGTAFAQSAPAERDVIKNSSRECAICHYEWSAPFIAESKDTLIATFPSEKEVSSEKMCFSCHDGSVLDSRASLWSPGVSGHKVGVRLKEGMNPPPIMPLVDGKITCMTCHTAHATPQPESADVQTGLFLRIDNANSQLCLSCHKEMSGKFSHPLKELTAEQKDGFKSDTLKLTKDNKVSCNTCHQIHGATEPLLLRQSGETMRLCQNCHERQIRPDESADGFEMSHPVAKAVEDARIRERVTRLGTRLGAGGELTCFSCHSVHTAKGANLLLQNNTSSAFCRQCHTEYDKLFNSPHNMENKRQYVSDQGQTARDVGACSACHGAHRWQKKLPNIAAATGKPAPDTMTSVCLSCHNPSGTASAKPIRWDMQNHYLGDVEKDRTTIESNPFLAGLPDSAKRFLDKYFSLKRPKTMSTRSAITCMTCHDIHSDGKMFVREEVRAGEMCISCHEKPREIERTLHGSQKLPKSCMSCHYVHNAPDERLLISGGRSEGCVNCHNDAATANPPAAMREKMPKELVVHGNSHPVDIDTNMTFKAPLKPNASGKLTCTSCHNPHIAQDIKSPLKRNFLRGSEVPTKREDFCVSCHEEKKAIAGTVHSADPQKPVLANARIGRNGETCDICHKVHNAETKEWIFNVKGVVKRADDYCVLCHSKGGQAKEKPFDYSRGHIVGKVSKATTVTKYLSSANGAFSLECRNCHDPHINGTKRGAPSNFGESFLRKLDTGYNLCLACHDDKLSLLGSGHDAVSYEFKTDDIDLKIQNKDVCGSCHTMHNSDRGYLMAGSTTEERCLNCHDNPDGITIKMIMTYHPKGENLKDRNTLSLPLENNGVTCKTCHEPHKRVKNLIRPQVAREEALCASCHKRQEPVSVSYHNMSLAHIKDDYVKEIAESNACVPCHSPHNFDPDQPYMWARAVRLDKDFVYDACIDCHRSGGLSPIVPKYLNHSALFQMLPSNDQWQEYVRSLYGKMSVRGEISCNTCHEPHVWSADPAKAAELVSYKGKVPLNGDNSTSFLMGSFVTDNFCSLCHNDAAERYDKYHMKDFREKAPTERGILKRLFSR